MIERPRIALIHATPVAVDPIKAAFAAGWPEAELANILDDSVSVDRARDAAITPRMFERFRVLARYAVDSNPNDMELHKDGRLFVSCANDNSVVVVDTAAVVVDCGRCC